MIKTHPPLARCVLQPLEIILKLHDLLDEAEKYQAVSFVYLRDRSRYIASHAGLRLLLSRYLNYDARDIKLTYNPFGKPRLFAEPMPFYFNMVHSHDLVVYAITLTAEVGIDVEYRRVLYEYLQLASRFFSYRELRHLNLLDEEQQEDAFGAMWTRKEGYIKARGLGLSIILNSFSVSPQLLISRLVVETTDCPSDTRVWFVEEFRPNEEYIGAIATSLSPISIRY